MKQVIIELPVFQARLIVVCGGSVNDALASYCDSIGEPRFYLAHPDEVSGYFYSVEGLRTLLVWFEAGATIEIAAHECIHALHNLFVQEMDTPLVEPSQECFAYTMQYLIKEITAYFYGGSLKAKKSNKKRPIVSNSRRASSGGHSSLANPRETVG